jgi:hypothetical protein
MEINSLEMELNLLHKVPLDRVSFRPLKKCVSFYYNITSGTVQQIVMKRETYYIRKNGEFNKARPIM